jgi:hypothetical protein
VFKVFKSYVHLCFADEDHWYTETQDLTWDVCLPCLNKFNERNKNLLRTLLLILDDSMSGWHPETMMMAGIHKLTWEPRKHVPLGTILRNGVEGITAILVCQILVQHADVMKKLEFYGEQLSLPNGAEIGAHTAEVLCQVEGANVVSGG